MTKMSWAGGIIRLLLRFRVYDLTLRSRLREPKQNLPILFPGDAERGRAIRVGDLIRLLRERGPVQTNVPVDLDQARSAQRFDWLADLHASEMETAETVARELTALWIDAHPAWHDFSWADHLIVDRLANWMLYAPFLLRGGDEIFREAFLDSMHRQARHVRRLNRFSMTGLDGFGRARSEIFYEIMFAGESRHLDDILSRLARQIMDETFPDGGHRSRNPSRHMAAIGNLLDVHSTLTVAGRDPPPWLQAALARMTPVLKMFCLGDGGLCGINGSLPTAPAEVERMLALAGVRTRAVVNAPHSGFQRLPAGQTVVLLDCGIADRINDNESAGILAFQFSSGRRKIVVNCGLPRLATPEVRTVCRGSAAHSTLILAETNSSELIGVESMGQRRAKRVDCMRQEIDRNILVESEQDGYLELFGVLHRRALYLSPDGTDIRGEDRLTGGGGVGGVIRFHLHPDVGASLVEGGRSVLLRSGKTEGWRFQTSADRPALEDSIYFGDGVPRHCCQIVVSFAHEGPSTLLKWRFARER